MRKHLWILILVVCAVQISWSQAAGAEKIAAVVNGEVILTGELDDYIQLRKKSDVDLSSLSEQQLNQVRLEALKFLIDEKLLINAIEQRLNPDQKDLVRQSVDRQTDRIIEQMQAPYSSPSALEQREKEMGVTWDEMRRIQRQQVYKDYLLHIVAPQIKRGEVQPPTPEEIQQYKKDNPGMFDDEMIQVAHILIRVPEDATEPQVAQALEKARQIATRARNGESFDELAATFSEHQETRAQGGVLPRFRKGQMFPQFDVLFGMDENTITDPIRTPLGFHVIKVLEKETPGKLLLRKKLEDVMKQWITDLHENAKIDIRIAAS
ncbi:MAG: hypothetical protein GC154_00385 [bacterium]|nr:hypothetical protein [bacterium]